VIREIEELFVEGEQVFFKEGVPGFSEADDYPTLRLIPLLTTADSKGPPRDWTNISRGDEGVQTVHCKWGLCSRMLPLLLWAFSVSILEPITTKNSTRRSSKWTSQSPNLRISFQWHLISIGAQVRKEVDFQFCPD